MKAWRLGLRALARAWRSGELRLLGIALALAVAAVTAVGFFADRIQVGLEHQSGELLAADRALESRQPIPSAWGAEARALGLRTARFQAFRTMVLAAGRFQMAEVKAVDGAYPLRGQLKVAATPYGAVEPAAHGPVAGAVWLDARLARALDLAPGQTLQLGHRRLAVTRILAYEPDRGGMAFTLAPRLMMNQADLPATGLIQNGSLVDYRLLVAGPDPALKRFAAWLKPRFGPGVRLVGGRDEQPALNSALSRADRFLALAALSAVLLAGVAAATAAHRHARRHFDAVAIMRCLGATQGQVLRIYLSQLLLLGVVAALIGVALGFAAHYALVELLARYLVETLPPPGWRPVGLGLATGLVTLAGFALPPLLGLRSVPPLRVLRRELGGMGVGGWLTYGSALVAITALMAWEARDATLTGLLWAGTLATVAVLAGAARLLVFLIGHLRGGGAWRFGLANIRRRARASTVQMVAIGLGLMVLLLLAVVRGQLLEQWRGSLPADAPNQFVINIQPRDLKPLREFFAAHGQPTPEFYPMIRGRLTAMNGRAVHPDDYPEPRARRLAAREFNLSYAAKLRADNHLTAGRWWDGSEQGGSWSVEEGIAKTLGIHLGDRLEFTIGGQPVTGIVRNLRKVEWDSFKVNFFVIAPPGQLPPQSASYITSFHVGAAERPLVGELVAAFPTLTVIDVDALMQRVRGIIERVSQAVEFIFVFTLLAGVLVLLAVIQAGHDERLHEVAILRTLGAGHTRIRKGLIAEFLTLGSLAGLLAAGMAAAVGIVVAQRLFDVSYQPTLMLWLGGLVVGALGVGVAGLLGTRQVLRLPPLVVLRRY